MKDIIFQTIFNYFIPKKYFEKFLNSFKLFFRNNVKFFIDSHVKLC